jgi:Flp pilus assembly protein TadD
LDAFVRILLEAGKAGQAVDLARVTAEMYSDVARAHSRYGEALALAGRRQEAGEAFAKALELDPMESRAIAYRRALLQ